MPGTLSSPTWQHRSWKTLRGEALSDDIYQTLSEKSCCCSETASCTYPSNQQEINGDALHTDFKESESQSKGQGVTAD